MTTTQIIAKQGWLGAIIFGVIFALCIWLEAGVCAFVVFVGLLVWLYAFRNPERIPHDSQNNAFYAPIDGIVRDINIVDSKVRISIETSFLDVGIIRAPMEILKGKIVQIQGLTLCKRSAQSEILNARMSFYNLHGLRFEMEFVPRILGSHGLFAAENLSCGERIGFMKMGMSSIVISQEKGDSEIEIAVNIGDRVHALHSVIGYFHEI